MTEKTEIKSRNISWKSFCAALISAPLLLAALTYPFSLIPEIGTIAAIPFGAMIFGGPVYFLFGTPTLIWFLRRYPPNVLPIMLLSVISLAGMVPIALIFWAITADNTVMAVLLGYLTYGAIFAAVWSATFALIYRWLIRRF